MFNFFKSKTGQVIGFGLVFSIAACLLIGALHFRQGGASAAPVTAPNLATTADKTQQPFSWFSRITDAGFANKHPNGAGDGGMPTNQAPAAPTVLPITLYHGEDQETEVSDTYAPYGRMIPCETVITIDSAKIETPIIGFVTEDV